MQHLALWLTRVQSESMTPCLRDGQLVWTIRCRSDRSLRRGAVVAVDSRELGFRIVKRIVGLPGEHLRFEGSELWVDGRNYTVSGEGYSTDGAISRAGISDEAAAAHLTSEPLNGTSREIASVTVSTSMPSPARSRIVARTSSAVCPGREIKNGKNRK